MAIDGYHNYFTVQAWIMDTDVGKGIVTIIIFFCEEDAESSVLPNTAFKMAPPVVGQSTLGSRIVLSLAAFFAFRVLEPHAVLVATETASWEEADLL
jgi:hypothetical protein